MFKTKFHISRLENEFIILEGNISKKLEELNLLEAELNYLTRPSRIEELLPKLEEKLEKKLGKKSPYYVIKPKQIIKSTEIPLKIP